MVSNIILRSKAKIAIKYENIVPHSGIFCTSILKVQKIQKIHRYALLTELVRQKLLKKWDSANQMCIDCYVKN